MTAPRDLYGLHPVEHHKYPMNTLLLSSTAISYVPVLLLHLVSLGHLLFQSQKSRQTWLFCGWLGGMTLMVATQCAAGLIYVPRVSAYLGWWGGVGGVSLAIVALLQFAYHFPRLRYPREARWALAVSSAITAGLLVWMLWETWRTGDHQLYATSPPRPDVALTTQAKWLMYDFERAIFGLAEARDAGFWVSFKFFDRWQIVGNLWVLSIWVRKTVQFSAAPGHRSMLRWAWAAFRCPQGREARLSRAWVGLMLLAPLTVVASILDAANMLSPGAFPAIQLLVLFAIMLTYVNYAPEPTTVMVKLVGISLVTLLVILGFVSGYALEAQQQAWTQMRRAELQHLRTLIADDRLADAPSEIWYVAARPVDGLFASQYEILYTRSGAPDAVQLAAHDALLHEGLMHNHFPARVAVQHEHPWLSIAEVGALAGDASAMDRLSIPEDVAFYRGSTSRPTDHVLRYTFIVGGVRYEVGYRYLAYRQYLHRRALPLLALLTGTTVLILVLFPRFFRVGLVTPLSKLLAGVDRVDQGDLSASVPVLFEDEIGRLTHAFNRMVHSLHASEENLRALNLTLEQRVADRTRDLSTLYEVAALVSQMRTLEDLFPNVLARLVPALDGEAGLILMPDAENGRLNLTAAHGLPSDLAPWVIDAPLWKKVWEEGDTWLIHDLNTDPRVPSMLSLPPIDDEWPYRTLVGVPIPGQEDTLGALGLFGATPLLFNVQDLGLLAAVAEQLGVAIENARLRERLAETLVWEERQRLARDLHDSVTQILYSQSLFADAAIKSLHAGRPENARQYLARMSEAADRALREMRLTIYRLRPTVLAQAGLAGALRRRLEMVEGRAGMQTHLTYEIPTALPEETEQTLYYIAEEALNNALKHAGANEVQVTVTCHDAQIVLSVADNGCGFDMAQVSLGLGLQSLRERAESLGGTLTLESWQASGTRVIARLPLETQ